MTEALGAIGAWKAATEAKSREMRLNFIVSTFAKGEKGVENGIETNHLVGQAQLHNLQVFGK